MTDERKPTLGGALVITAVLALGLGTWACDNKGGNGGEDTATDTNTDGVDTAGDTQPDVSDDDAGTDVPMDTPEEEAGDPCWPYPCAPYGNALGNVIANLEFLPGNTTATTMAGDATFSLGDLYQTNEEHGGNLKGILIWVTTGWCPYCAVEAPKLEGLYNELRAQGIVIVGLVTEDDAGNPATPAVANAYAAEYGWTFPAVSGDLADNYWPPADIASGSVGVPLHLFVDARTMQIYGRFAGATEMKLPRYGLQALIDGPEWGPGGTRIVDFDCAPGTGNEVEPNGLADEPQDGTTLPYTLTGAECPPVIADGILMDEDVVDLGTLAAGAVIDVTMTATGTPTDVYPFFSLVRVNAAGTTIEWQTLGPSDMDVDSTQRQWVIDTAGHYMLAAFDGRNWSGAYYGDATPPLADQCCDGGPDYTYDLVVSTFLLDATEAELVIGTGTAATFDTYDLNVHPFTATSGTMYTITMTSGDYALLDPYIVLYNPATGSSLAFNDDINTAGGNYDSRVTWSAPADGTYWVVAGYWGAWFNGTPAYTLLVAP